MATKLETPEDLIELAEWLGRVSRGYTHNDTYNARKLAEVIKTKIEDDARRSMAEHRRRPMLYQYMNDGWSIRLRRMAIARHDNFSVVRSGRLYSEFLLHRAILTYSTPTGETQKHMLFEDILGLTEGTKRVGTFSEHVWISGTCPGRGAMKACARVLAFSTV